jgi:hypothetical protein
MENQKKSKKDYQSTKDYSKKYNKENINVQLNRDLILKLRQELKDETLKDYLEKLIIEKLNF